VAAVVQEVDGAAPMLAPAVQALRVEVLIPMAIFHLLRRRQSQFLKVPGVLLRQSWTNPRTHLFNLEALGEEPPNRMGQEQLLPLLRLGGVIPRFRRKLQHGEHLAQPVLGVVIPILVSMDQMLLQLKPLLQLLLLRR
jgi:hypothetical protein